MTLAPLPPHCGIISDDGKVLYSPELQQFPWLKHACTTREFSPADANRAHELHDLQTYLGLPPCPILYAQQKHTNHVGVVNDTVLSHCSQDGRFIFKETDAIVCPVANVSIAVFTADCTPIFLVDEKTRAIGLVHAGWKGTFGRIAERAVATMVEAGSSPENLLAWIGPAISGCCYEVSEEMVGQFRAGFEDAAAAGLEIADGRMLDVVGLNVFQLQKAGISTERVHWSRICTLHERDRFYSYRGDNKTTGRIISFMTVV